MAVDILQAKSVVRYVRYSLNGMVYGVLAVAID
jgi:hypothetical protein